MPCAQSCWLPCEPWHRAGMGCSWILLSHSLCCHWCSLPWLGSPAPLCSLKQGLRSQNALESLQGGAGGSQARHWNTEMSQAGAGGSQHSTETQKCPGEGEPCSVLLWDVQGSSSRALSGRTAAPRLRQSHLRSRYITPPGGHLEPNPRACRTQASLSWAVLDKAELWRSPVFTLPRPWQPSPAPALCCTHTPARTLRLQPELHRLHEQQLSWVPHLLSSSGSKSATLPG